MCERDDERNGDLVAANDELNQLIGVVSQDLRVPLASIMGYSRDLSMSLVDLRGLLNALPLDDEALAEFEGLIEDDLADRVRLIQNISAQMDRIIGGMLTMSQLRQCALVPVNVHMQGLIEDLIDAHRGSAQRALARVEISGVLPDCVGDAALLTQLFEHLVVNALSFLDDNRPGQIRISGRIESDRAIYCVEDNGIGVDAEHRERIFELFHQLSAQPQSGGGMGLAIVRRIVETHMGDIHVEAGEPHGTRLVVTLRTSAEAFAP